MNSPDRPPVPVIAKHEARALLRQERRRTRFDAYVAIIFALIFGFAYAQIARKMGATSPWIGITALIAQFATFTFAMWMKVSDLIFPRKAL